MLKEAVAHYHSLLEDPALAAESFEMLRNGLERNKLIFGGRPLSPYLRPHFVTASDWSRVITACELIWSALQKVNDAAAADVSLLNELGMTGIEKELAAIDPGYAAVAPNARLDSFLSENAYSFVELNGESPAGIAYSDSASEIFWSLPVMQRFMESYSLERLEGRPKMLEVLLSCYEEYLGRKPDQTPVIAIVDLKDLPTQKEFELFKEYFEYSGYTSIICSPDELEFDNGRLYRDGIVIDIVYKRLLVNEYLPVIDQYPALADAYRARAVCMVNSFRGKLVHKKAIFAILTNERYAHLFDANELAAIGYHIPWTRKFSESKTEHAGEVIDLVAWTRANSHKLVLKPNDDYGGHGIYIGWSVTTEEWDEAIGLALADGDYLVQERVETAKETFPMLFDDLGDWAMAEQLVDLDPLLFNGKVGSAFTRLSSSELANVTSGGGMVPTFILNDES
jgi:hypothetical protein